MFFMFEGMNPGKRVQRYGLFDYERHFRSLFNHLVFLSVLSVSVIFFTTKSTENTKIH